MKEKPEGSPSPAGKKRIARAAKRQAYRDKRKGHAWAQVKAAAKAKPGAVVKKAAKPVLKPGPGGGGRDPTPPAKRVTFGPNEPDVPPPSPLGAPDFGHLRAPSPGKDMRLKTPSASPGRAANSDGKGKGKKGGKAGGKGGKKR